MNSDQERRTAPRNVLLTLAGSQTLKASVSPGGRQNGAAMKNLSSKYQPWIDARQRFHLSHAHIQMARELGLNPKTLGKRKRAERKAESGVALERQQAVSADPAMCGAAGPGI